MPLKPAGPMPGRLFTFWCFLALSAVAVGCGGGLRQFPLEEPLWDDPDRRPVPGPPQEYESPFAWDAADQTIFRPVSRFFAVDPAGEAVNVNAMDEVPDSSWFTNRVGMAEVTEEALERGPCPERVLDPQEGPWTVTDAKPNGANPGFIIEDPDGRKWLLKFDGLDQPERATAADVIGSRIYWAAGYYAPCNLVVFFDRSVLRIDPEAEAENAEGEDVPMRQEHVETVLAAGVRDGDGRYRASASLFLEGKPLGPWRYQGTRDDDPNDVVAHEDRRDLRGMYVLASWLNHFDSREQNTLATWIEGDDGRGHVRHNLIDFGDSFGSIWEYEGITRRLGHAYYLDIPYLAEDFVTLGLIERPWDDPEYGAAGRVFAYYDVDSFVPDRWRAGYPNPAFGRMSERDAAWMARIIARIDDETLATLVEQGRIQSDVAREELMRILRGRREKILRRWFQEVSPLAHPRIVERGGQAELCMEDLAVTGGVAPPEQRWYAGRAYLGESLTRAPLEGLRATGDPDAHVCAPLPEVPGASPQGPRYLIVDVAGLTGREDERNPARVHLYHLGGEQYRIVGLERPYGSEPPER